MAMLVTSVPALTTPAANEQLDIIAQESAGDKFRDLFDEQRAMVKTVRNTDWLELISKLRTGNFRTSASLPPPGGVGMRLFGEKCTSCCGLVWDRSELDLSEAFIWPSGYMAKTEFNMNHKGELLNGRSSALVTIERLMECNSHRLTTNADTGELQEIPIGANLAFNEINWPCRGTDGLVAVFVRSVDVDHVLHALGVVALLEHALGCQLPLVLMDSANPVRTLDETVQRAFLREVPKPSIPETLPMALVPRFPIAVNHLTELSDAQKLELHSLYGITASCLRQIFLKHTSDPARFHELLSMGLRECVARRNVPSAREIVRTTSPMMVNFSLNQEVAEHEHSFIAEVLSLCKFLPEGSEDLLVVLGAKVMLAEFRSGRTQHRIDVAIRDIGEWLKRVTTQCTVCDVFSWMETWRTERGSRMSSFISGKAVSNRSDFLRHLKKLRDAEDGDAYVRELCEVVHALRSPCLRFRILRDVVGLDDRFSRNVVHAIVCFAFDIFVPRARSAFEVDEATRLEVEESERIFRRPSREILGVETPELFTADPLGLQPRLSRAQYRQNRSRKA
ncbi:unnamed protein product [Symbiodinium natans]|uniref:Uncharacterized protein n=1 Tax=Symbiodinium natans TaxID=878477 RepID=A0A812K662_9DINO|nr:unnamed protein product [Symbiodinium natans]